MNRRPPERPPGGRNLPDFIVAGAQKCGTSALWKTLREHPDVHMAQSADDNIEFHFFDQQWHRGRAWYEQHFTRHDRLQGEKTPCYIYHPRAHRRMAQVVPHARLIIALRNPVDRAYSHWNHFNQATPEQKRQWRWVITDFESALSERAGLLHRGYYAQQLNSLLEYYPPEQIHVLVTERIARDPIAAHAEVCDFLGIRRLDRPMAFAHVRSYDAEMTTETRARLVDHFRPRNARLYAMLGERIEEWDR